MGILLNESQGWNGTVDTYAELPPAADHYGEIWAVTTSTGIFPFRKNAGLYISNGTTWTNFSAFDYPSISATAPISYDDSTGLISTSMSTNKLIGRYSSGSGVMQEITIGSGLTLSGGGTLSAAGSGGTVTTVSVATANGFAGTVSNATTTPEITLSTTITGVLLGNGTSVSGLNYASTNTPSSLVYRDSNGDFSSRYITATKFSSYLSSGTAYLAELYGAVGTNPSIIIGNTNNYLRMGVNSSNEVNIEFLPYYSSIWTRAPLIQGYVTGGNISNLYLSSDNLILAGITTEITDTLKLSALTASQALVTDSNKNVTSIQYTTDNIASTIVQRNGVGNITVGIVNGNLNGNASSASSVAVSTTGINSTYYPTFVGAEGSTQQVLIVNSLTFNPSTGNLAATSFSGALTGNASTATTLQTGRTISITGDLTYTSPSFDGSSNITAAGTLATVNSNVGSFGSSTAIPSFTVNAKGLITAASTNAVIAPAGTLTGTTLASNVVTSSLTAVGTITTGTWNATTIAVNRGGTGQTTYTNGQLLIGNTTGNTLTKATLTQGTGITITNGTGSITIANTGVTTLTGTTNQVNVSASTGSVTLSTPQDIATSSTPTFAGLIANGSTQLTYKVLLSGQEFYQAANTSTSGIALLAGVNRTGNRQLWIADSAALTQNSTNSVLRILIGGTSTPAIDAIATNGTTALGLNIQSGGGSTTFGGDIVTENINPATSNTYTVGAAGNYYSTIYTNRVGFGGGSTFDLNIIMQAPNVVTAQARCAGWNTYSDARLKNNIQDYGKERALEDVRRMRLRSYWWNRNQGDNFEGYTPQEQVGYIAQELYEVMPTACNLDKDGIATSVDYGKASVKFVGAIQALDEKIIELTKRIEVLQNNAVIN